MVRTSDIPPCARYATESVDGAIDQLAGSADTLQWHGERSVTNRKMACGTGGDSRKLNAKAGSQLAQIAFG